MATDVKSSPSISESCKFTSEPAKSLLNHESSRLTRCANLVELTESCKVAAAYLITKFGFDTAENEPSSGNDLFNTTTSYLQPSLARGRLDLDDLMRPEDVQVVEGEGAELPQQVALREAEAAERPQRVDLFPALA